MSSRPWRPWPAGLVLYAVLLLPALPCAGQIAAEVSPPVLAVPRSSVVTVSVVVDVQTGGTALGSYGATLSWDPAVVEYLDDTGGGAVPFDGAVVNRGDVALGWLSLADADPVGRSGRFVLMRVIFHTIAEPVVSTSLDLELTSAFEAGTFTDLLPSASTLDGEIHVTDHEFELRPADPAGAYWEWNPVTGALTYDVIRGDLSGLLDDTTFVQLGAVVCIENDSTDTTTAAGADPPNPDAAVPVPGGVFFYLVRLEDGVAPQSYGFSHPAVHERIAGGGC